MQKLLSHTLRYFIARGIPALISFLTVFLFTRILSPDEYGVYSLIISSAALVNVIVFQWLKSSFLRFLPRYQGAQRQIRLLATVLYCFCIVAGIIGSIAVVSAIWIEPRDVKLLGLLVGLLVIGQGLLELTLEIARAQLKPMLYGGLSALKAALGLGLSLIALSWFGLGVSGIVGALILAHLLSIVVAWPRLWGPVLPRLTKTIASPLLAYGAPLTATFALTYVVSSSDRFIIAFLLGEAEAGIYSAAYSIGQLPVGVLLSILGAAAVPLVFRAHEQSTVDSQAQDKMLRNNWIVLITALFPLTVGCIALAPSLAQLLGTSFQNAAVSLIPLVSVGTLLSGIRSHHFDLAFQLRQRTGILVLNMGVAAVVNVGMNFVLIPSMGIQGAALATILAYGAALTLSAGGASRQLLRRLPIAYTVKVCFAGFAMWLTLQSAKTQVSTLTLAIILVLSLLVYVGLLLLTNISASKRIFIALRRRSGVK